MRVSTCHGRVRSTVSYAFWRSMKHMKRDTPAFRPISCSLCITNTMPVVERSGRDPHCSSGKQSLRLAVSAKSPGNHLKEHLTLV